MCVVLQIPAFMSDREKTICGLMNLLKRREKQNAWRFLYINNVNQFVKYILKRTRLEDFVTGSMVC